MEVGSAIRKFREERGYTLEELASKASISVSYLSEIERGRKRPSLRALDKVCSALNVSKEAILPDRGEGNHVTLGNKIRMLRQDKALTLDELSKRIGISPGYLSEIERGVIYPAIDTLRALAVELEIPVAVLLAHAGNRIGEKLRELRESMGITQTSLASRTGLSAALIGQIETGKVQPSLKSLEKIAEALGISPCYLIIERDQLQDMLAAMGPDLRQLLMEPNVQAVLRQICHLNEKQLRFILNFIEVFKQSGL